MTRSELEHIIRAAAGHTGERELVVIGAAALLATIADPPAELAQTQEADIYPMHHPELAELLNDMGELSSFHDHFHIYAHGVGPETAILSPGWEERLVPIRNENTGQNTGYCLEPLDIAASKLAAGREKDIAFVAAMLEHGIVDAGTLHGRIADLPLAQERKQSLQSWVASRTIRPSAS